MSDMKVDEVGMTIEDAWFVLEHGSAEGLQVYLKAIKTIKKNCVDVVRCKDCKYLANMYKCPCFYSKEKQPDDWFCADGERNEGR
jgi:hypothetical protein